MQNNLFFTAINSPLCTLYALAHDTALLYLGFDDISVAQHNKPALYTLLLDNGIKVDKNPILETLEHELTLYFNHNLTTFTLPVELIGTPFQKKVWSTLSTIPYGTTRSYKKQAEYINIAKAYRAVGNANSANMVAIVIPCHRIIAHNGTLGGYAGGISRKEWLLKHEKQFMRDVFVNTSLK